jgi:RimJ/RimL family protein N-acetyltransferase
VTGRWRAIFRPVLRVDLLAGAKALDDPLPTPAVEPVALRLALPDDFPSLASLAEAEIRGIPDFPLRVSFLDEFARLHHKGDVCFLLEIDGRIAYFSWVAFDTAALSAYGLISPLLEGEAYVSMSYTFPAYRRRGVATAARVEANRWLRDHGVRQAYSWVRTHNTASLKVRERAGWRVVGQLTQFIWRIRRRYTLLTVTTNDPDDPLSTWCGPERLNIDGGIRITRRGAAGSG